MTPKQRVCRLATGSSAARFGVSLGENGTRAGATGFVVVSGKAASVAELRQADLRLTNRPKAAFGLDQQGVLRRESPTEPTVVIRQ